MIGWSVAFIVAMGLVYGPHKAIVPGNREWDTDENILFGAFQHPLWGLVIAWVIYACHYGYGSKFNAVWGSQGGGGKRGNLRASVPHLKRCLKLYTIYQLKTPDFKIFPDKHAPPRTPLTYQ